MEQQMTGRFNFRDYLNLIFVISFPVFMVLDFWKGYHFWVAIDFFFVLSSGYLIYRKLRPRQ